MLEVDSPSNYWTNMFNFLQSLSPRPWRVRALRLRVRAAWGAPVFGGWRRAPSLLTREVEAPAGQGQA
eukprot:6415049-Prymnesium_polylepis.1